MTSKLITNRYLFSSKNNLKEGTEVSLQGLIKSNRNMGEIGFIGLDDGSSPKFVQLVYNAKQNPEYDAYRMGCSIEVLGKIHYTPELKQPFEIQVTKITLTGSITEDYPLQKKKTSFDYLRTLPTYRMRTNTFSSVFRIRSAVSFAIHKYFNEHGFMYIHTPIFTGNDCEGAGEAFQVVTDLKKPNDYFNKQASLTVSGQLHVEPFALEYQKVYTFGPTFRAEKSTTTRHAAEFWMIEPEIAYAHLDDLLDLMEDFLKSITKDVLENYKDDIDFFNERIDTTLISRLNSFINDKFVRLTYTDAIEDLKKAVKKGHKFEISNIEWGMDLKSEHERYLTEVLYKSPVFLYNYPKDIKAFYMKQNDDGKTVAAADLLVPNIGELCGSSEREDNYDKLLTLMQEKGMNIEAYQWYLDLRRQGGCHHAGFGLGFERYLMFITGMTNIRDVLPYPRTYKEMDF